MKIERINENKIKVLIGDEEAREWNLTLKKISENTPEAQRMFRHAIDMAKESIDFSVDGAKLFVEAIPSFTDGIGMLITKVCNKNELANAISNCSYKGKIRRSELTPPLQRHTPIKQSIYVFDSFESVCAGARVLSGRYKGVSSLYKLDERFYLHLAPSEALSLCEANTILCEFADRVQGWEYIHGKLNECGILLIEKNAIDIISEYF